MHQCKVKFKLQVIGSETKSQSSGCKNFGFMYFDNI